MLAATPTSLLSRNFTLSADGRLLGRLDQASFRERATVTLDGTPYTFSHHRLQRAYTLEVAGREVARARREGLVRRIFEVTADGGAAGASPLALRLQQRRSLLSLSHRFDVSDGRDVVATIRRPNLFGRRAQADFPPSIPLPVQVFLLWIALMMWKRDDSSGD